MDMNMAIVSLLLLVAVIAVGFKKGQCRDSCNLYCIYIRDDNGNQGC